MRSLFRTLAAILPLAVAAPSGLSPRDYDTGCSTQSFNDFTWTIEDFTYRASYLFTTPAHQVSTGYVDFNLSNPALPETVSCQADSTWLTDFFYGNINYKCAVPEGSKTKTSFAFSRPSGRLDVNQTWTCEDRDYPITFGGYGTVNLTLDCKEDQYQNPNWTMGQIYSSRFITCAPVTLPLKPHDETAIA
ncbi:hypothetical protein GGR50DRAFT_698469 [Xylaria sp. CBS 124048]|nr:hypothetical protein GGR50DRAFT_698469 [Xylaria sp. CBS 124048]